MSYGDWLQRAYDNLAQAQVRLGSDPAPTLDDVSATLAARQRVYAGVARLIELVLGDRPARSDIDRNTVDHALEIDGGDHATRLYLGITAAARAPVPGEAGTEPIGRVGRHLDAAAKAVSAAGDILASHAPPRRTALTPEGVAIRAGAGRKAALADIAALTRELLSVDANLPEWMRRSHRLTADTHATAMDEIGWASRSRLEDIAGEVHRAASGAPPLLRTLDVPPLVGRQRPIRTGVEAYRSLLALRDWMHRNPAEVRAAHLTRATRLGLIISTLATPEAAGADWRAWNAAAQAAGKLHGVPPQGPGAEIVDDLDLLAQWIRPGPPRPTQISNGPRSATIDKIAATLPSLADVLATATLKAAGQGNLFVLGPRELEPFPRNGVFYAVARWCVARPDDEQIQGLKARLFAASAPALRSSYLPRAAPRLAKLAFPAPAQSSEIVRDRSDQQPWRYSGPQEARHRHHS